MKGLLVLPPGAATVNLPAARRTPTFRSVDSDPPSPRVIVRTILGVAVATATLWVAVRFVRTGVMDWKIAGFALLLWGFWGFAATIFDSVLEPLAGFLYRALFFGSSISTEEETQWLEQELQRPGLEPEHEILTGIRLAEMYRTHQYNKARADAVLDRLMAKYPDSRELQVARRHPA